jgi:membrane-associated phospholipid phosphatase
MDRHLLAWTSAIAAALMLLGFAGLDRTIAEGLHAVGAEQSYGFQAVLGVLDLLAGLGLWIWLLGIATLIVGLVGWAVRRDDRWPRALIVAALVQLAAIGTMILGKDFFGRSRPQQVLEAGDWSHVWFAGGASFPSGHAAFYFGLLLPLAAAVQHPRLRALLVAIPVYVSIARIDLAKHFLSDVAASALMVAVYALVAAWLVRRWLPAPAPMNSPLRIRSFR